MNKKSGKIKFINFYEISEHILIVNFYVDIIDKNFFIKISLNKSFDIINIIQLLKEYCDSNEKYDIYKWVEHLKHNNYDVMIIKPSEIMFSW